MKDRVKEARTPLTSLHSSTPLSASAAARDLDAELARRINPERSRRFQPEQFAANLEFLERATRLRRPQLPGLRVAVVGSNGKGSTAFFLASLLSSLVPGGRPSVGLYTSPHLLDVCERIRLDLMPISPAEILGRIQSLQELSGNRMLSYFEVLTAIAWDLFAERELAFAVFEAGLGGRLDATRIARCQFVIVMPIVPEHTAVLGSDPALILREKLGICTEEARTVIVSPQPLLSKETIRELAQDVCPRAHLVFVPETTGSSATYLDSSLALARAALREITGSEPSPDFRPPAPPGRLELRPREGGVVCYDTAHNPDALLTLGRSLPFLPGFPGASSTSVYFACLPDRESALMRQALAKGGFARIVQVEGEGLAVAEGDCLALADLEGVVSTDRAGCLLFTGTHRLYAAFDRLFPEKYAGQNGRAQGMFPDGSGDRT